MIKSTAWISGVTVVVGSITACLVFFETYGWVTRQTYEDDHKEKIPPATIQEMKKLIEDINVIKDLNIKQRQCDRLDKLLPELATKEEHTTNKAERNKIKREIRKSEEHWEALDCTQFM